MKFGAVPLEQAQGAILAHSADLRGGPLRKGHVLTAADLARMAAEGWQDVVVARLEAGDVPEDEAATRLAMALVPAGDSGLMLTPPVNGRVNLKAIWPGVLSLNVPAVHGFNRIDPGITLATLPPLARVATGTLVGTVKIITYAVPEAGLRRAAAVGEGALRILPVVQRTASLLLTEVPSTGDKLTQKGRRAVEGRLRALGITLTECHVMPHDAAQMAQALRAMTGDMLLILTGSATSDLQDTGPQSLRMAGGQVARFGMPVDPGNLLFHGTLGARPVIGLPGCARSPALNGADWVLERLACGLAVTDDDIADMGVGGLLKEIPIRPQPRERGPA
jgi:molybdenum cofactor cytidylyltransferase